MSKMLGLVRDVLLQLCVCGCVWVCEYPDAQNASALLPNCIVALCGGKHLCVGVCVCVLVCGSQLGASSMWLWKRRMSLLPLWDSGGCSQQPWLGSMQHHAISARGHVIVTSITSPLGHQPTALLKVSAFSCPRTSWFVVPALFPFIILTQHEHLQHCSLCNRKLMCCRTEKRGAWFCGFRMC